MRAALAFCAAALLALGARADEALWRQIADGGYVLLIRHAATEPGTGDPPQFALDDCSTQRNLSQAGREEAARLGEAFRARRIPVGEVRASPWCRCLDTARLAFGRAEKWDALKSLFNDASRAQAQRREVTAYAQRAPRHSNLVLVTHNFNIRELVGVSPSQAEVVVAKSEGGALRLVGRIPPP